MARRAAVYARISVTSEESVSVARQVKAAQQYADSRGWQVVGTFTDDGVSATHSKPEDRAGWQALLASREQYDAVIVWKVDRLARRVLDFLHADEALQQRGAGIVCVEDPIDMTTANGRMFATMLAAFGEMEAAAISARVKAARNYLIKAGRVVGGRVPYGWRSVSNPDGAGMVLVHDPDRVGYVRGMVARVQRGDSVYSVKQWLDDAGAPTPAGRGGWQYSTVERILRHPVLAGMTPHNPGNGGKARGDELLRGDDGLPVVDPSTAIMEVGAWRALVKALDTRASAQARPRAMRAKTSGLLSGLVYCGEHLDETGQGTRMHRGTIQGRHGYVCPTCHHAISNFEAEVVAEFLRQKGDHVRWSVVEEVHEGGAALLPEIELRLDQLDDLIRLAPDRAARQALQAEQANLLDLRDEKRAEEPVVRLEMQPAGRYADDWGQAATVEDRRAVLGDALARVWVVRGRPGRRAAGAVLARLTFEWNQPDELGPLPDPDPADLAAARD